MSNLFHKFAYLIFALAVAAMAQTRIDLRTQAKSVDFSEAPYTKPLQTGTSLPATCSSGQMFLNLGAAPGSNIYACTTDGVWVVQSASGTLSLGSDDTLVGSVSNINFQSGAGLINLVQAADSQAKVQFSLDTAVVQTQAGEQSGAALLCASNRGLNTNYECSMTPAALRYTTGMVLHWQPDVSVSGGGTTLNIDTLGPIAVKLSDGITNPSPSDIVGKNLYTIWYDGSVFRLPPTGSRGTNQGPLTMTANNGAGGIETYSDGSTVTWSCGSGSGATCSGIWNVPAGINWVRVQAWSGGGGGGGSSNIYADHGGGGGGYWEAICPTIPNGTVAVTIGLGGSGSTGFSSAGGNGGNSSFGSCVTVLGGASGGTGNNIIGWGGRLAGTMPFGWFSGTASLSPTNDLGSYNNCAGAGSVRNDGGGNGGGAMTSVDTPGLPGGASINGGGGGGSGGNLNATGGIGGTSGMGGAGGTGGGWTASGGVTPCTAGSVPGGGGGAAASGTPYPTTLSGCAGARGELRIYYAN